MVEGLKESGFKFRTFLVQWQYCTFLHTNPLPIQMTSRFHFTGSGPTCSNVHRLNEVKETWSEDRELPQS